MNRPAPDSAEPAPRAVEKARLRGEIRAVRRAATARVDAGDARERAAQALSKAILAAYPWVMQSPAQTVSVYESLPTEPPTAPLIDALLTAGVRVIVPVMLPDKDLDWVHLTREGREGPDSTGSAGTVGPLLGRTAIAQAALIVVPALAVDRWGGRMGQGGGSYDRALNRRRADAHIVALVFDGEVRDVPLPSEAHDVPVDAVVTPTGGWLPCQRHRDRVDDPRADLGE